ncbi:GNAT family N-acetyltransferase [Salipaludibacillus sp. CUR1]|uniref:GNAT family N-acetyltransferase n=1 Tax=Salipaludibacillus sp. CUR1 TaxID=2820003 RepID=UPI001E5ACE8D|nr:GNAT family N-acetyltransferase [Salipaludibacillus sp. CUR1]
MTIRKLKQSEIEYSIRMSEFAFQYYMTDEERQERLETVNPDETWVIEENGEIISKASIIPLEVYINGKAFNMGGVSGVVTWPEHRRGGLVSRLMNHCLKEMKQNGQTISFLYPFSIPFYRKYGWELFADSALLTLTREQLPNCQPCRGYVRRIDKDPALVGAVYETWASQYSGALRRSEKWWKQSVFKRKKGTVAAYYNESGHITGYLIYEMKERKMTIHELIWLDADTRRGLWNFISNHDSMADSISIKTAAHGRLPFLLEDPKIKREVSSYFMARIVDVKEFLTSFPFENGEAGPPVILHVEDKTCKWNEGTYIIKPAGDDGRNQVDFYPLQPENEENGKTGATCQHPPKKGLKLSVQSLTAVLFGTQSVQTLIEEEWIAGDEKSAELLARRIPRQKPFIYDFF